MTFQSPGMYIFLSSALLLLGMASLNRVKRHVFLALNIIFILLVIPQPRLFSGLILLAWMLSHYLSLQLMLRVEAKRLVFILWLILDLVWFVTVKEYHWITGSFLGGHAFAIWWSVLGYSFILFRQIHLSVHVRDGMIKSVRPLDYLNYNLAFWTFLAGPIQRYDDFIEHMRRFETEDVPLQDSLKAFNRIVWGLIKMAVIAPFFQQYAVITTFTAAPSAAAFALFFISFPLYLYLNFSGYCDTVIGVGRAVGFRVPENFRVPFIARNMVDFWNRWHISLSEFFRDYLYYPMMVAASRRFNPLLSLVGVTFISFFLMGIWHGNEIRFVLFGVLQGLGVVITLLYGELLKALLPKPALKAYKNNGAVRAAAIVVCQCYVMATFLVFQYSFHDLYQVMAVIGGRSV